MTDKSQRPKVATSTIDMKPDELKSYPELTLQYQKWKEDPITKMVFGMLKDLAEPNANGADFLMALSADRGLIGSMLYAKQCGAQWMIATAMSFDDDEVPTKELEADFGAEEIMKNELLTERE